MAWNEVNEVDASKGIYTVCGKLWLVGPRYKLQGHIGSGTYGDVCKAIDLEFNQIIALKRVPDIFYCHMLAKRVLREVCIMRRLCHPYIISLTNVFTTQNLESSDTTDLYIATEFAERGDLYHQNEPLTPVALRLLIWQLLVAVQYMHSCHVWHRDIKSENLLLTAKMCVKLCDFGLARSALETSTALEPKPTRRRPGTAKKPMLVRQYTKMVVTPSHRAPEVVMSQGQYTSAIDMWSVGCIFGELLMRQSYLQGQGSRAKPLFGVRGEPNTPLVGEAYTDDATSELHEQLDVTFDVIGTPCWKDIESVPSDHWRAYLKKVPGRAGNVVKRLSGHVSDDAIDLLQRMLAFDPARRCTADEALLHTYFKGMKVSHDVPSITSVGRAPLVLPDHPVWKISEPAVALGLLERELEMSTTQVDGGKHKLELLLQREVEQQQLQNHMRKSMLNSMPKMVPPQVQPLLASSGVLAPREIQFFPCTISRADDASGASLDSLPYETRSVERSIEDQGEDPDCQILECLPTRGSTESDISWEPGQGMQNALTLANGVGATYNEQMVDDPPAKRQRKMTIRQGSLRIELNRGPQVVSNSQPVARAGKDKSAMSSSNNTTGQHSQAGKDNAGERANPSSCMRPGM
ncbi:unnamed protein product [Sphagnum jensenii]|uniref:Protein kinase domain-containing protein n=1 Tax=Sphagnum jensenii TaxID=128206 RepID=A0ABP0X492_9BRYO